MSLIQWTNFQAFKMVEVINVPETEHPKWARKSDFFLAGISCIVGLGDLSLFPLLVYKNGGGAFLIPYFTLLMTFGLPTLLLELALGQFTNSGPLTCWNFCPLIAGCGINMMLLLLILSVYYNGVVSWGFYFFFSSLPSRVPWMSCGNWSSKYCITNVKLQSKTECFIEGTLLPNGVCAHPNNETHLWIWNERIARRNGIILTYPTYEYFERVTLGNTNNAFDMESYSPQVVLCLLLCSVIIWMILMKGTMFSIKVTIGFWVILYLILAAFVIRGMTLEGALDGFVYFMIPDLHKDVSPKRWVAAGHHVCFSLSLVYGSFIALSSYNKFHYDILRDALLFSAVDNITGILAGIAVFTHLGHVSNVMRVDIDGLAKGGPLGVFDIFPYTLSKLPSPSIWTPLFFFMIICIGVNSQRIIMQTLILTILDWKPSLKERKYTIISTVSFCVFLCGLPMATSEGLDILDVLAMTGGGINIFILVLTENIAVGWLYGGDTFLRDVETMIQGRFCGCVTFGRICRMYWRLAWKFIAPVSLVILIVISGTSQEETHPAWPRYVSALFCIGSMAGTAIYNLATAQGTMKERWKTTTTLIREWGPELQENRRLVNQYNPNITVNLNRPSINESVHNKRASEISTLQVKKEWDDVQTDYDGGETDKV